MTPERLEQIRLAFNAVLGCSPGAREELLAQLSGQDSDLREEVEKLLAAHGRSHPFLDGQAAAHLLGIGVEQESLEGRRVGAYRVVRRIAEGGMGTVFEAHRSDDVFAKRVAAKVCKATLIGETMRDRFQRERQILARLEHPNIARILDGGTTEEGAPYFVMEFVDGLPLDRYVGEQRLGLKECLRLFCDVCHAVAYAHRNLVVHRDLKPSNVFVTRDGTVKLLDFGIAKLLAQEDSQLSGASTQTAMGVMTPDYAAPEQIRGEPVTMATDVYALGVLLYGLLTGRRPYRVPADRPWELAQAVLEQEPARPSAVAARARTREVTDRVEAPLDRLGLRPAQLRRRLQGDLDRIVLKALEKRSERRYSSAEALGADVERHLDGLPVTARGDALGYRAGKFIRRHRLGVAAATVVFVSLIGGLVGMAWQARRAEIARQEAERQRQRAEQRFVQVRRLVNALLFDFHDAVADLPGGVRARQLVASKAQEYLDGLEREAAGSAELQREVAVAHDRVGDASVKSGDLATALKSYSRAQTIRRGLLVKNPRDRSARLALSLSLTKLGDGTLATGDTRGAVARYLEAADADERLLQEEPGNVEVEKQLQDVAARLCERLGQAGDPTGAITWCRRRLELAEALAVRSPNDPKLREMRVAAFTQLAVALRAAGQEGEAQRAFADARLWAGEISRTGWAQERHVGIWKRRPKSKDNQTGWMPGNVVTTLQVEKTENLAKTTYFNALGQPVITFTTAGDGNPVPVWGPHGKRIGTISVRRIDETRLETWGEGLPYIYEQSTLSPDGRTWTSEARMRAPSGLEYTDVDIWEKQPPRDAAAKSVGFPNSPSIVQKKKP